MQRLELKIPHSNPTDEQARFRASKAPLFVFKFGSSVLRTPTDIPRVAGEIYRHTRHGERVIAIVSALEGETDALFAASNQLAGKAVCAGIAEVVSLGEEKTAALLKIACDRIGLRAEVARPEAFGISTDGSLMEGYPLCLHGPLSDLERRQVIIVPGYVGVDRAGCRSLLGRGGSDFSAIFIGGELEADVIRLYKDVDGVFDHDPAQDAAKLFRFDQVSWADCLKLARPLLQPRAIDYAKTRHRQIEVTAIGSREPTLVGPQTLSPTLFRKPRKLRIALAGYGTVGQAIVDRLAFEERFDIAAILVRDADKARAVLPPVPLTLNIEAFDKTEADVVVDVTSDETVGLALLTCALERGTPAISASKQVIGKNLEQLERLALENRAELLYSATVGGNAPMIEAIRSVSTRKSIVRIDAVLNGTVNFILDQISSGLPATEACALARGAGFAEADLTQDLSGKDAALKLRILAAQLLGPVRLVDIDVEPVGIARLEEIAGDGRWVQHACLEFGNGTASGFVRVRPASDLRGIEAPRGERNHLAITTSDGKTISVTGRGAGGAPTAEAVIADLYDVLKQFRG